MRRLVVFGLLLAACTPVSPVKAPAKPPSVGPSAPVLLAPPATPSPVTTIAPTPAPALAALTGILRIPAKIISDNGGGILSNNGGSIISDNGGGVVANNGAGYRLQAAPTQLPVAQATVTLVDAAGQVLATTTTDAQGRYAFASVPSDHNYLLAATLGKAGTLQAIVPPGGKQVDTDLVSTLTTAYILDQYVKGDPKVLDKLPADVEADTRAKAAAALTALPDSLQPAKVVAAVDALRRSDATFDAQMETVKRLLLVAGQSNNGVGRKALDVAFKGITQLGYGPDGLLYVLAPYDRRLYRIDADGYLQIVAGSGTEDAKSQEGKALDQADLGYLDQVILGKDGIVLLDQVGPLARISRAGADGVLHELARQQGAGPNPQWDGIASLPDGGWAILADDAKLHGELWALVPPAAPVKRASLPDQRVSWINGITRLPGSNRLIFDAPTAQIFYFRPFGVALPGFTVDADALGPVTVFYDLAEGAYLAPPAPPIKLEALRADGGRETLLESYPDLQPQAFTRDRAGRVVFATKDVIYRLEDGKPVRLAGGGDQALSAKATDQALSNPVAVAPALDGGQYVVDANGLLRIKPDGSSTRLAASFSQRITVGKDGQLYAFDHGVVQLQGDGTLKALSSLTETSLFVPGLVAPLNDGRILASGAAPPELHAVDATKDEKLASFTEATVCGIGQAPDGTIYVTAVQGGFGPAASGPSALYRLKPGGAKELVVTDDRFADALGGGLAVDAKGRVYFVDRRTLETPSIERYDPATKAFVTIAGANGRVFKGDGADTTLRNPRSLAFDAQGNLLFADQDARQIRQVPAAVLAE